jgi:uncharacterized protein
MGDAADATTETGPRHGAATVSRRAALIGGFAAAMLAGMPKAFAQSVRFFRIGAGPIGGTLFPAAGWISGAISNPPGSRPCERNGSCGVPGLIALAQSTEGGVANIEALRDGAIDAALAYAGMAHDALAGRGPFQKAGPFSDLCAVATLAPETLHVLVRYGGPVAKIADLKGKKVAVGAEGQGPAVVAEEVLRAHGIGPKQFQAIGLNPDAAAGALAAGEIDAMIFLAHAPAAVAVQMIADHGGVLLPLGPDRVQTVEKADAYLFAAEIPRSAYGRAPVTTVATVPVLLVKAALDAHLVTAMSRALWLAMKVESGNHPLDANTFAAGQIARRGVPLHPAAQAFRDELIRNPGIPR